MGLLATRRAPRDLQKIAVGIAMDEFYVARPQDRERMEYAFGLVTMFLVHEMVEDIGRDRAIQEFNTVGLVFAPMARALQVGINGHPVFPVCHFVHVNDMQYLDGYLRDAENSLSAMKEGKCEHCGVRTDLFLHVPNGPGVCTLSPLRS